MGGEGGDDGLVVAVVAEVVAEGLAVNRMVAVAEVRWAMETEVGLGAVMVGEGWEAETAVWWRRWRRRWRWR